MTKMHTGPFGSKLEICAFLELPQTPIIRTLDTRLYIVCLHRSNVMLRSVKKHLIDRHT
jgi:hypothetical protein